jgi:uncharacterized membrane protein
MCAPASIRYTLHYLPRLFVAVLIGLSLAPATALADFRLCNVTGSRVGVAIGYAIGKNWVSEGWWNIDASKCETVLKGPLVARYYYVYALDYDHGGEWGGKSFMCTRRHEFTIRGLNDCRSRGFDRTGFFEIDTGEQRSWIVQLTETKGAVPAKTAATEASPAERGAALGRSAAVGANETARSGTKSEKSAQ